MDYHLLTEDKKHEALANFLLAQEQDHHLHLLNKARYEKMLPRLSPGKFKDRIKDLLDTTEERILEVESILVATREDIKDHQPLKDALARLDARRQANQRG